ncbi:keratin, type I cytoskeletal 18-like protein [Lates japonicus]|uniref:Keratin, type I cytoskeletal 18-like protein n=1 Tax=Lates japonicus TaxID=270547 RepID=A0AAD3M203_LATJO|nr:keratin, type I cytoskeletal 18-like protein [Lates japonicus]
MQTSRQTTYSMRSSTSGRTPAISVTRASVPTYRARSVHGGATGHRISVSSTHRSGLGAGMGVGSGAGSFSSSVQVSGNSADIMGNEKFAMQNLNDRLANYLETVRTLEQANHKLEIKIKEALEKSGPDFRDYSKYQAILDDLRKKVRRGLGEHGSPTVTYGCRFGSGFGGYDCTSLLRSWNPGHPFRLSRCSTWRRPSPASYLETVRNLEKANSKLEIKIREAIEKRGPLEGRDYGKYNAIIAELRAKIFDMIKGNAHLAIALDNARLASDDFRVKMEYEMSMRQTVEADVARLRKVLDDTNVIRLHLESDIESLKEELITLKKNHEADVAELRAQITQVGVQVDVDAPKGQDLSKIMEEMRAKYEKIALKNQEELKAWHESQITEVQVQVTESTEALKEATSVMTETRRRYQALDIELQSALSLKASLEATLRDIEMRHNMEVEKYNKIILRLQEELTQIRTDIQHNTREYEHLLNIKVKLEAEIAEYRRLLDRGTDIKLEDAVDKKTVQTKVVTLTQTLVDGKVVSESKDVKSS